MLLPVPEKVQVQLVGFPDEACFLRFTGEREVRLGSGTLLPEIEIVSRAGSLQGGEGDHPVACQGGTSGTPGIIDLVAGSGVQASYLVIRIAAEFHVRAHRDGVPPGSIGGCFPFHQVRFVGIHMGRTPHRHFYATFRCHGPGRGILFVDGAGKGAGDVLGACRAGAEDQDYQNQKGCRGHRIHSGSIGHSVILGKGAFPQRTRTYRSGQRSTRWAHDAWKGIIRCGLRFRLKKIVIFTWGWGEMSTLLA
jgi:hypothetical protein